MSGVATTGMEAARPLGERNGLRLAVRPRPRHDTGHLIRESDSAALIHGVRANGSGAP